MWYKAFLKPNECSVAFVSTEQRGSIAGLHRAAQEQLMRWSIPVLPSQSDQSKNGNFASPGEGALHGHESQLCARSRLGLMPLLNLHKIKCLVCTVSSCLQSPCPLVCGPSFSINLRKSSSMWMAPEENVAAQHQGLPYFVAASNHFGGFFVLFFYLKHILYFLPFDHVSAFISSTLTSFFTYTFTKL